MANRKTPRPKKLAQAVERKAEKVQAADKVKKAHWNLVLVEVVFSFTDNPTDVKILKIQFPEKTDFKTFPSHRIQRLMNAGALQIRNAFPTEMHDKFKVHDAFILNIQPLGQMTDDEFWRGRAMDQQDAAPVSVSETPAPDNIVPFTPAAAADTDNT